MVGHERQLSLDAVRGLAILLVLAFHFSVRSGNAAVDAVLQPIAGAGWAGVDLFFVLSGFLVGRMILAEAERPEGLDVRRFFTRRMWRLWPALYVYLGALASIGGGDVAARVLPVLLHVQNYGGGDINHLWSLAVEEHFYVVSAFVLPWLVRRHGPRRLIGALLAIMALCLLLRTGALLAGVPPLEVQWRTHYRVDALACGVLLAAVRLHHPAVFAWLVRQRAPLAVIAATGYAILVVGDPGTFRHGIGFTIAYVAAAALILATYDATAPAVLRAPIRWLAALGTISYSLYIWHTSIGQVGAGLAAGAGVTAPLGRTAAAYATAILWAWLAYRTIERPMMALRDDRLQRRAAIPACS